MPSKRHSYTRRMASFYLRGVVVGVVAGFISGLFGVGGGVIVVPGLVLWLGLDQRRASGTSMATIVVSASAAALLFSADRAVDWPAAWWLFVGAGAGAVIGARAITKVPEIWLTRAFATVMVLAAVRLLLP